MKKKDGWLDNFLGLILNPILVNMEMDDGKKEILFARVFNLLNYYFFFDSNGWGESLKYVLS